MQNVLLRISNTGFTLNDLKCNFFQNLPYLGHIIDNGTISLDPKRISVIKDFQVPKNVKELRRLIGMTQFCRRFVKNLNIILSPLYDLTRANTAYDLVT